MINPELELELQKEFGPRFSELTHNGMLESAKDLLRNPQVFKEGEEDDLLSLKESVRSMMLEIEGFEILEGLVEGEDKKKRMKEVVYKIIGLYKYNLEKAVLKERLLCSEHIKDIDSKESKKAHCFKCNEIHNKKVEFLSNYF